MSRKVKQKHRNKQKAWRLMAGSADALRGLGLGRATKSILSGFAAADPLLRKRKLAGVMTFSPGRGVEPSPHASQTDRRWWGYPPALKVNSVDLDCDGLRPAMRELLSGNSLSIS